VEMIRLSLEMVFHPAEAFRYMQKDRSRFNYVPAVILLLLAFVVRTVSIYITHFPLAELDPRDANIGLELIKLYAPLLTWVIASYAMTSILDGESLLREGLLATAYALVPYILLTIPVNLLSHIMENSQSGLYNGIQIIITGWVLLLLFMSIQVMNQYSLKKTTLVCALSVGVVLLIWATIALFFAISSQFINFIEEVIIEIRLRLLE